MVDRTDAELIAAPWLSQDSSLVELPEFGMHEFDLGWVFWRTLPSGDPRAVGAGRAVVDRRNGEMTYWSSVPVEMVVEQYRAFRERVPVAPLTWDPVAQARRDRVRTQYPVNMTHLRLADGRLRIGRGMKGDAIPHLHRLVRDFLDELPVRFRERGNDRCSEVAVLSDLLHQEDTSRAAVGEPPLSIEQVRDELLRGADLTTYRVREPADPAGGHPTAPCVSCQVLLRHVGFALQPPTGEETR
ncbi:YwqJ-related putative deaminase [Plantactinospora sp. GCM10030261]|uniref:YwqJ-related putative deaminase n=1 Tax=Plantactinospora sp. GCM10030261 TaxID=3273420 RepID=UPI0036233DE5